jgi:pyruvate dehydrogenase E2 component (dihydrolipoamide acetyltransferase)
MPEVADDPTVATLTAWLVGESGDFAGAQSLATVETDTSLVSIEVAEPGVLVKSLVEPGQRVAPGSALAVLAAPGEVVGDVEQLMVELGLAVAPEATDAQVHLRPVSHGDPLYATTWPPHDHVASPDAQPTPAEPTPAQPTPAQPTPAQPASAAPQAAEPTPAEPQVSAEPAPAEPEASAEPAPAEPAVVRRVVAWADTVAQRVVETVRVTEARPSSTATAAAPAAPPRQLTVREEVRADQLSAVFTEVDAVSLIALVVKAVAATSRRLPLRTDVASPADIALLRWTESGPVAPVVRVANLMTASSLTTTLADVDARVREGRLAAAELDQAAVTVVDLGADGAGQALLEATAAHPVVLTVGALREQPVVERGEIVAGTVMHVVLSCDASRISGAVATRWLAELTRLLEQPLLFLT